MRKCGGANGINDGKRETISKRRLLGRADLVLTTISRGVVSGSAAPLTNGGEDGVCGQGKGGRTWWFAWTQFSSGHNVGQGFCDMILRALYPLRAIEGRNVELGLIWASCGERIKRQITSPFN
uniref:Uncharacterized protein n=1 Tax=Oryza glumipatula TaxID=40148 RepID=A0A0D9YB99_9ORYZ